LIHGGPVPVVELTWRIHLMGDVWSRYPYPWLPQSYRPSGLLGCCRQSRPPEGLEECRRAHLCRGTVSEWSGVSCTEVTHRRKSFLVQERCCSRGHPRFDVFELVVWKRNNRVNSPEKGKKREFILENESLSCENGSATPGLECFLCGFDGLLELRGSRFWDTGKQCLR